MLGTLQAGQWGCRSYLPLWTATSISSGNVFQLKQEVHVSEILAENVQRTVLISVPDSCVRPENSVGEEKECSVQPF